MELLKLFFQKARFKNINKQTEERLLKINPKQVINKVKDIPMIVYQVNYSYTTVRNNKKEGEKYFIYNSFNPNIDMEIELQKYIEEFNKLNPSRKLLNVKILNNQCLGYMAL